VIFIRYLLAHTADNALLTTVEIGLIPAPRKCSLPPASEASVERGHPVKSVNECAQCGANLIEPEWSEHFPDHRIRNVWSCDACGYEFEDTVYYSARELAEAS
jgi:ribosomal protein L37AE/L43A